MVDKGLRVPLSPPISPRMSDSTRRAEHQHAMQLARSGQHSHREHEASSVGYSEDVNFYPHDPSDHSLRPYKSFAYSSKPSGTSCNQRNADTYHRNASSESQQSTKSIHGLYSMDSTEFRSATYGVSSSTSPADRLTPNSPDMSVQGQQDDDDLIDSAGEDQDEDSDKVQMTAAELRAHKRKMKRFRLTHSQTRFLMSEFARQAHPDAAHRERLAREIPGLSARQVQVWFQNRRAKLKRHTTDDQARMMRSRALPDDFDTTQALHSPFGAQQPHMGASSSSLATYPMYNEHGSVRPLTLDTVRGIGEYGPYSPAYASPSGVSPALGAFAFTPPRSVSDHISPGPSSSMSPYVTQHQAAYESSRRAPICLPALDQGSTPAHQLQQGPPHDQMSRTPIESTGFPIRGSVSYPEGSSSSQPHPLPERSSSYSDHVMYGHQRSHQPGNVGMTESDAHGPSFPYAPPQTYTSKPHLRPMSGQHATNAENFRRVPPSLPYQQYPPPSYTSAPYQNYTQQYPSHDGSSDHHQEVHAGLFGHAQRVHDQPHALPGTHQHFAHTAGNQVTEASGGTYGTMPSSY